MNLTVRLNGVEYNAVQGVTFSEEFNETLDSAVVKITHIPRIANIEPYDDVYIYDSDTFDFENDIKVMRNPNHDFTKGMPFPTKLYIDEDVNVEEVFNGLLGQIDIMIGNGQNLYPIIKVANSNGDKTISIKKTFNSEWETLDTTEGGWVGISHYGIDLGDIDTTIYNVDNRYPWNGTLISNRYPVTCDNPFIGISWLTNTMSKSCVLVIREKRISATIP